MLAALRQIPPVCLVVRWPQGISSSVANSIAASLAEARLIATWAVEQPAQCDSLKIQNRRGVQISTCLLTVAGKDAANLAAIEAGLERFHAEGQDMAAIYVENSLARGVAERRLYQSGVRAIILGPSRGESSLVRPLPFGLWEFGPHACVPGRRRWWGVGRERSSFDSIAASSSPIVATIDLARGGGSAVERSVRPWLAQVGAAVANLQLRAVTAAELATELSAATVARPQRSILRAAS